MSLLPEERRRRPGSGTFSRRMTLLSVAVNDEVKTKRHRSHLDLLLPRRALSRTRTRVVDAVYRHRFLVCAGLDTANLPNLILCQGLGFPATQLSETPRLASRA
jgi:hypothetical protein